VAAAVVESSARKPGMAASSATAQRNPRAIKGEQSFLCLIVVCLAGRRFILQREYGYKSR
jgi:hypothetical protein